MGTDLRKIPGVGKNIEQHLIDLGFRCVADLKGQDPEEMYLRDCLMKETKLDRCLLYVYRLAVYFAANDDLDQEKLKWWNWKD